MAELRKREDREDWIRWAIELMRRGLWLGPEITVHGPHEPPSDYMWGEAEASIDGEKDSLGLCVFSTTRQARKYHPSHVKITDSACPEVIFPLKKESELKANARRWLKVARRLVERIEEEKAEMRRKGFWKKRNRKRSLETDSRRNH